MIERTILRRRLPARERSTNGHHGPGELSVAAFAASIAPRLRALLAKAPRSEALLRAVAAWLDRRGPESDAAEAASPR